MTSDEPDRWPALLTAIAGPNPMQAALALTDRITRDEVGARLYTVSSYDPAARDCSRLYTSDAEAYPLFGRKPVAADRWSETVLDAKRPFVANRLDEFADLFPDHALIRSLGCESVVNLPVVVGEAVVGTINILDVAGHFTPARLAALTALMPFYTVAVLAALVSTAPRWAAAHSLDSPPGARSTPSHINEVVGPASPPAPGGSGA